MILQFTKKFFFFEGGSEESNQCKGLVGGKVVVVDG